MCSDLELKASEMNKTLSRKDGTPDKSLQEMKEEIQDMLAEMRKRQLQEKKNIAEEEMKYRHTHKHTHACPQTNVCAGSSVFLPLTLQNTVFWENASKRSLPLTLVLLIVLQTSSREQGRKKKTKSL